jgi:hypothetical protein
MEVHHAHHPAHKKKWSEYLLEFFMLFFAVTLGFFAENQREQLTEKHREQQYMQSLYEDLKNDTATLNNLVHYDTIQTAKLDSTNLILKNRKWDPTTIKLLYRLNLKTLGSIRFNLSERTAAQLKNAGGMRLVEKRQLSNKIAEYWARTENLRQYENFVEDLKLKAREKSYSIFDQNYYEDVTFGLVSADAKLMTQDNYFLTEYANRLNHVNNSLKKVLLPSVARINKKALDLIIELKKEYKLDENGKADATIF